MSDDTKPILRTLISTGALQEKLLALTDRQVGQLAFDHVWDELAAPSPALAISIEATERLFRSTSGARSREQVLNDPAKLPACPECGEAMIHRIGIAEADYRVCTNKECCHKIAEGNGGVGL